MSKTVIPERYRSALSVYQTQTAIGQVKRTFEDRLSHALNLKRVSAPLFVDPLTGLNDDLSGVERPVSFDIPETGSDGQIVHSLAKWKRLALKAYGFPVGEGLYTDMNAVRRDEVMDNFHSIYVDQWDWELVIDREQRNMQYLQQTVVRIVDAIYDTQEYLRGIYPQLSHRVKRDIHFITSQELEDRYPGLTPKQREDEYVRTHHTAFILGIGDKLNSGQPHDGRAPDYDDWSLNGDLMIWDDVLGSAMEVSSMGIRVDSQVLAAQLTKANCEYRRELPFHKLLLNDELPLTIGGGIGQSRLCMLLFGKAHIGEVQVSLWDDETKRICRAAGINLL